MLETERLVIRDLHDHDSLDSYLSWMRNPADLPFIRGASSSMTLKSLAAYLKEVLENPTALQLGLFAKDSGAHIGNIKLYGFSTDFSECRVGFLIGEKRYRGKGLAAEGFNAIACYIAEHLGTRAVRLGVEPDNRRAVKAYQKMGFQRVNDGSDSSYIEMCTQLKDLGC